MTPQPVIAETRISEGRCKLTGADTRIVETKILWDGPDGSIDVLVRMEEPRDKAMEAGMLDSTRNADMAEYSVVIARRIAELPQLLAEVEGLRAFKAAVDAALNSGDGSYRP